MIERSGAPVGGVDPGWLQHQYQLQMQPGVVAQLILAGQAPRSMGAPMGQPMYQAAQTAPRRAGCGQAMNVIVGIVGFVAIIGGFLYALNYISKKYEPQKPKMRIDSTSDAPSLAEDPASRDKLLRSKGLDPNIAYPYWPLVYDLNMVPDKAIILGSITNYGDRDVINVTVQFGLFNANGDKVGVAQDSIGLLGPGQVWRYRALVNSNYEKCQLENIIRTEKMN